MNTRRWLKSASFSTCSSRDKVRRRAVPSCERLETLSLLSVFGAATTDATVSAVATRSITQTLTLPAEYTNIDAAPLSSALQLFDPSVGTLVDVKISGTVSVSSTLGAENTGLAGADINGSLTGDATIQGLSQPLSASLSATTPVFHAAAFDGTIDHAGTSGTSLSLAPTATLAATLTGASALAFYSAGPGHSTVNPTATIQAAVTENGSSGSIQFQVATKASASVTVTFDYTPAIAAPAAVALAKPIHQTVSVVHSPSLVHTITSKPIPAGSIHRAVVVHRPTPRTPVIPVTVTPTPIFPKNDPFPHFTPPPVYILPAWFYTGL